MAATSLGLVGIVSKGDYNSATTYVRGNFVYHNYCSWLCIVASTTGIEPTEQNNTIWQLLAKGINLATFTGATASAAGTGGSVPAPQAGDEGKALMGDGTWDYAGELSWTGTTAEWNTLSTSEKAQYAGKKVYITDDYIQNIPVMIGASASEDGYKGIVPTPHAGDENKVLHGDGTFKHQFSKIVKIGDYTTSNTYADMITDVGTLLASLSKENKMNVAVFAGFQEGDINSMVYLSNFASSGNFMFSSSKATSTGFSMVSFGKVGAAAHFYECIGKASDNSITISDSASSNFSNARSYYLAY